MAQTVAMHVKAINYYSVESGCKLKYIQNLPFNYMSKLHFIHLSVILP